MKLRNKKTGEIVDFCYLQNDYIAPLVLTFKMNDKPVMRTYNSLAELNEEWEDYQEPKTHWYIYGAEPLEVDEHNWNKGFIDELKSIGNYFETKEEAEKAVEKLKAWKRLKDSGLKINKWLHTPDMDLTTGSFITIKGYIPQVMKNMKDLDLLFGGSDDN